MAQDMPGLAPRKLDADIQMDVPERLMEEAALSSESTLAPTVSPQGETHTEDNTPATEEAPRLDLPQEETSPVEDREFSERASR